MRFLKYWLDNLTRGSHSDVEKSRLLKWFNLFVLKCLIELKLIGIGENVQGIVRRKLKTEDE